MKSQFDAFFIHLQLFIPFFSKTSFETVEKTKPTQVEEEDEATAKAVNDDDSEEAVLDPGTPIPSEEEDGGPCLGDAKNHEGCNRRSLRCLFRDLFFEEVKLQNAKTVCTSCVCPGRSRRTSES